MVATMAGTFTDEELAEQALAAGMVEEPEEGAVDFWSVVGDGPAPLVADWYMPVGRGHRLHGWRRRVVLAIVIAFLLIDAAGLCSTYGFVVPA